MSFQNLRAGSPFYILHKGEKPYIEQAQATFVSPTTAKYPNTPNYQNQNLEQVIDIQAKVGESMFNYQKIPAHMDVVDCGNGTTLICTRDAALAEVYNLKQLSQDALSKQTYHQSVIAGCDEIITILNPEILERKKQAEENQILRNEVAELKSKMDLLLKSLNG